MSEKAKAQRQLKGNKLKFQSQSFLGTSCFLKGHLNINMIISERKTIRHSISLHHPVLNFPFFMQLEKQGKLNGEKAAKDSRQEMSFAAEIYWVEMGNFDYHLY